MGQLFLLDPDRLAVQGPLGRQVSSKFLGGSVILQAQAGYCPQAFRQASVQQTFKAD